MSLYGHVGVCSDTGSGYSDEDAPPSESAMPVITRPDSVSLQLNADYPEHMTVVFCPLPVTEPDSRRTVRLWPVRGGAGCSISCCATKRTALLAYKTLPPPAKPSHSSHAPATYRHRLHRVVESGCHHIPPRMHRPAPRPSIPQHPAEHEAVNLTILHHAGIPFPQNHLLPVMQALFQVTRTPAIHNTGRTGMPMKNQDHRSEDDSLENSEPTEAERAEALERFLAAGGRYPGVAAELRRCRLAEIEAGYPDEESLAARRRERVGI